MSRVVMPARPLQPLHLHPPLPRVHRLQDTASPRAPLRAPSRAPPAADRDRDFFSVLVRAYVATAQWTPAGVLSATSNLSAGWLHSLVGGPGPGPGPGPSDHLSSIRASTHASTSSHQAASPSGPRTPSPHPQSLRAGPAPGQAPSQAPGPAAQQPDSRDSMDAYASLTSLRCGNACDVPLGDPLLGDPLSPGGPLLGGPLLNLSGHASEGEDPAGLLAGLPAVHVGVVEQLLIAWRHILLDPLGPNTTDMGLLNATLSANLSDDGLRGAEGSVGYMQLGNSSWIEHEELVHIIKMVVVAIVLGLVILATVIGK